MGRLFKRSAAVEVHKAGPKFFGTQSFDVTEIRGLRIEFKIERTIGKEPNKCEATVTNLSPSSRALFHERPLIVKLKAGYDGEESVLFSGDARHCQSTQEGSDWRTVVTIADGDRAYMHANISKTWARGTPIVAVIREMAAAMDLSPPAVSDGRALRGAYSADGRVSRELTLFLSAYDLSWSVQDGSLQILRPGTGSTVEAVDVSRETGLVGSPEFGAPERPGAKSVLKCRSLINPLIYPGRYARISSSAVTGIFLVHQVSHSGDTHGADWVTEFEAVPV